MRARSLNFQNCFKLSENNESVLKSSQNRDEISRFADLVFQSENRYPGGVSKSTRTFRGTCDFEKNFRENLTKIQPKNRNLQF